MKKYQFWSIMLILSGISLIISDIVDILTGHIKHLSLFGMSGFMLCFIAVIVAILGLMIDRNK